MCGRLSGVSANSPSHARGIFGRAKTGNLVSKYARNTVHANSTGEWTKLRGRITGRDHDTVRADDTVTGANVHAIALRLDRCTDEHSNTRAPAAAPARITPTQAR